MILRTVFNRNRKARQLEINHARERSRRVLKYGPISWNRVYGRLVSTAEIVCHLNTDRNAERRNLKIVQAPASASVNAYLLSEIEEESTLQKHNLNKERLRVPRKPPWTKGMTTAQLDRQEKDAFLDWRRELAQYVNIAAVACDTLI